MSEKIYTMDEIRAISAPIAKSYGISAMYLFGSYARNEADSFSDLDFRIDKGRLSGIWKLAELLTALEKAFDKRIDLVTCADSGLVKNIGVDEVRIYAEAEG